MNCVPRGGHIPLGRRIPRLYGCANLHGLDLEAWGLLLLFHTFFTAEETEMIFRPDSLSYKASVSSRVSSNALTDTKYDCDDKGIQRTFTLQSFHDQSILDQSLRMSSNVCETTFVCETSLQHGDIHYEPLHYKVSVITQSWIVK